MPSRETLEHFAASQATLVVHLSVHVLDSVVARLLPHYGPDCPVAVVYRASWPDQQIVRGTLSTIVERVGQSPIERTATILVGRVLGAQSKWMTLVPAERDTDVEFIGQCIRHIKRQLKRAWPLALDGQLQEKIYVQPNAFGPQSLKSKEPYRLPEIPNLFIANHLLAMRSGEISSLEVVQDVEAALFEGRVSAAPSRESGASEF